MVTLSVGADGKINLFNSGGRVCALVDVLGWYAKDDSVRVAPRAWARSSATAEGDAVRLDQLQDPANGNLPFASGDFLD